MAASFLNVNNIIYMLTGFRQVGSVVMLICCLVSLMVLGRRVIPTSLILFIFTIVTYILFGWLYSQLSEIDDDSKSYVISFLGTMLAVCATAVYVQDVMSRKKLFSLYSFLTKLLLISTSSIYLSPLLLPFWNFLPLSSEDRQSGFFLNPNEAGFIASGALAFVLLKPAMRASIRLILVVFCLGGIALTLSKSAILCAVTIILLAAIFSRNKLPVAISAILAMFLIIMAYDPAILPRLVLEQELIELSLSQQQRVLSLTYFQDAQMFDALTTGRTLLWDAGLERVYEAFPYGYGLGAFHHLVNVRLFEDMWLGVHNTPLMILGEAGLVPFLFFVCTVASISLSLLKQRGPPLALLIFVIIAADFNSNHSALEVRYANVYLGLLIALTGYHDLRRRDGLSRLLKTQ